MREVDLATFAAAQAGGATVIDVREPSEYTDGHVPGARCVPLGHLPDAIADLPRDKPVYVICASGNRSKAAADLLSRAGIDGRSVAGGTAGWTRGGRPVTRGNRA